MTTMRRSPDLRPESMLQYALDEIERLKGRMTIITDGRNLVTSPGDTPPPPISGAPHVLYGSKHTQSLHVTDGGGLDAAYEAGQVMISVTFYAISAGTVALDDNATNNIYVDNTGTVTASTSAFPSDCVQLAVATTVAGAITGIEDRRAYLHTGGVGEHELLSDTHTDTLASAVSRGSIPVGNATPKYAELPIGANTYIFGSDGVDADWHPQSFIDHGLLGGLADDDHTQYVLRSILTTNGDLFVRLAGVVDRLGVGASPDGYVLTLASGLPSWAAAASGYTDEMAQDAVGLILLDTASIDFSYDDGTPTISAVVLAAGVDHGGLGGLADDDHTGYFLLVGRAGGQTAYGGNAAGESLIFHSTFHATKASIKLGALFEADEAGTKIGFFGVSPVVRASAYTVSNSTPDRTYDATSTSIDELAQVVAAIIADMKLYGLLQ